MEDEAMPTFLAKGGVSVNVLIGEGYYLAGSLK